MVDVVCIPDPLSLLNVLTVDEVVMAYKLLFTVLMFFVLAIPALAQTQPDIDHTPISATAIDADGSAWTVYSVAPGQITPNETVLVSFRSSDGKEHALRLRGGRLVLEGEADAMAKGMMKVFGEMLVSEMKRQGVKVVTEHQMPCPNTVEQPLTRLNRRN
jgi:hypothetical protein